MIVRMPAGSAIAVREARRHDELQAALELRVAVFCSEQGVPREQELDADDAGALHLVAIADGTVLGTCRLLFDATSSVARLGRMAVRGDARRSGVGAALLDAALASARELGVARVTLHAQRPAQRLYAGRGFRVTGGPFQEAGIEHVPMELALGDPLGPSAGGGPKPGPTRVMPPRDA